MNQIEWLNHQNKKPKCPTYMCLSVYKKKGSKGQRNHQDENPNTKTMSNQTHFIIYLK